ncbi:GntR family transcriptional regulator [Mangrovactinospora gilvigrisea]|uniref:GntR family transcriptional regulator n=1 Tax=Mangrovactinospora gilvigrisea TaxID=1428644 RepID=A0A1J7C3Y1_9ACTN|nr:GntR family transcriptional regulator [Mangrovactinospora gilvigrisea]
MDRARLSVDRNSPVPLYFQVAQQLEAAIDSGKLEHGSLLGNEIDLADALGLSRPTMRQAIQSLVDKGLLVRRRGVGTQVVHTRVRRPLELSSLYDDLSETGQRPGTALLGLEREPAEGRVAEALGLPVGTEVLRVDRLRSAQGAPIARMRNHLPLEVVGEESVREALESGGLYALLRARGVRMHSARQTVGARAADAAEAAQLAEEEGAPLLTMERVTFDERGRAVEFGSHLYRASRYSFEFSLLARG